MYRIIIPLLISILCINCTFSQNNFNSKLLSLELSAYNSNNDSLKNDFIIQKIDLYLRNNIQNIEVLNEVRRINFSYLKDTAQKSNLLWNSALIAYLNDDIYYSLFYLNQFELLSQDSTIETQLLKTLVYSQYNPKISAELVQDLVLKNTDFTCLECLSKIEENRLKHSLWIKRSSYIFPGLGMCFTGNGVKGVTSMALNTSTFFAVRWLFQNHLYLNMFAWGSNLIVKFYIGNIKLTQKLIDKKESSFRGRKASECSITIASILDRYPFQYKLISF